MGAAATWDGSRYGPQIYSGGHYTDSTKGLSNEVPDRVLKSVIWDHVEVKLATQLRHPSAPRDVVLFLDRPPCPPPLGCSVQLKHLIPRGKSITIYIAGKNGGVVPYKRITGTGRYLK